MLHIDMDTMVRRVREREPLYADLKAAWAQLMQQEETKHLILDDFIAEARRIHGLRGWEAELVRRRILGLDSGTVVHDQPWGPDLTK
ncbi:hypothetical protein HY624_04010 [Candidatus Uhrbacteria bacterium]|nr:hypothetical protein [Candidatus Uhrbacteria bacterium]